MVGLGQAGHPGCRRVPVQDVPRSRGQRLREPAARRATRAIIAPNHVSLLDAPIMHSHPAARTPPSPSTPAWRKTWWVKPFLHLVNAHAIDPTKPLGTRHLINAVKGGETLVIFPEGRLTVTGGLMKVYDGTAMIADKADAVDRPGAHRRPRALALRLPEPLSGQEGLVPEDDRHHPAAGEARRAAGRCKGKARRQAAGAALQDIMVDAAVKTANLDQTLFSALVEAKDTRDTGKPAIEDPLGDQALLQEAHSRAPRCSAQARAAGSRGRERRRHAAELGRRRGDVLCRCRPSAACRRC